MNNPKMKNHDTDEPEDLSFRKSPEVQEIPPKRQKLEISKSSRSRTPETVSLLRNRESRLLKAQLESLCTRLSHPEADSIELYDIRKEIDEIVEKKQSVLLLKSSAGMIEKLRRHLEAALKSNAELLQSLMTAEATIIQRKTAMEQSSTALLVELKARESSGSGELQEDNREVLKRQQRALEEEISQLEHQLNENLLSQKELDLQDRELEESLGTLETIGKKTKESKTNSVPQNGSNCLKINPKNVNYQELNSLLAESMDSTDSDEDLEYSKKMLSTLQAAVEQKAPFQEQPTTPEDRVVDPEEAEQIKRIEASLEELAARLDDLQSSDSTSEASEQQNSPQQIEGIPLEPEALRCQIDYDPWEPYFATIEHEYLNPSDSDFPWYSPDDDGALPEQRIDFDVNGNNEGMWNKCKSVDSSVPGMIGVPDWLLSPEASSSAISTEKSPLYTSDETLSPDSYGGLSSPDSDSLETEEERDPLEKLKLAVGKHLILVSSKEYFDIQWSNECVQLEMEGNKWFCRNCRHVERARPRMEDHVWLEHYGGHFKCPHCPFNSDKNFYKSRGFPGGHYKSKHPHLIAEHEQKPRKKKGKCG